jgi:hypothetical protein
MVRTSIPIQPIAEIVPFWSPRRTGAMRLSRFMTILVQQPAMEGLCFHDTGDEGELHTCEWNSGPSAPVAT